MPILNTDRCGRPRVAEIDSGKAGIVAARRPGYSPTGTQDGRRQDY